jgi:hypothetical protein
MRTDGLHGSSCTTIASRLACSQANARAKEQWPRSRSGAYVLRVLHHVALDTGPLTGTMEGVLDALIAAGQRGGRAPVGSRGATEGKDGPSSFAARSFVQGLDSEPHMRYGAPERGQRQRMGTPPRADRLALALLTSTTLTGPCPVVLSSGK